jgi:hypothetical protein
VNAEESYCIRNMQILVRVHGIPIDFMSSVRVTVITFVVCTAVTIMILIYMKYLELHPKKADMGDDIFGGMGGEPDIFGGGAPPPPTESKPKPAYLNKLKQAPQLI